MVQLTTPATMDILSYTNTHDHPHTPLMTSEQINSSNRIYTIIPATAAAAAGGNGISDGRIPDGDIYTLPSPSEKHARLHREHQQQQILLDAARAEEFFTNHSLLVEQPTVQVQQVQSARTHKSTTRRHAHSHSAYQPTTSLFPAISPSSGCSATSRDHSKEARAKFSYTSVIATVPPRSLAASKLLQLPVAFDGPRLPVSSSVPSGLPDITFHPSWTAHARNTSWPHPRDRPGYDKSKALHPAKVGLSRFILKQQQRAKQKALEEELARKEASRFGGGTLGETQAERPKLEGTPSTRNLERWFFHPGRQNPMAEQLQQEQMWQQHHQQHQYYFDSHQHRQQPEFDSPTTLDQSYTHSPAPPEEKQPYPSDFSSSNSGSAAISPTNGSGMASPARSGSGSASGSTSPPNGSTSNSTVTSTSAGGRRPNKSISSEPDETPLQKWKRRQAESKAQMEESQRKEQEQRRKEAAVALKLRMQQQQEQEAEALARKTEADRLAQEELLLKKTKEDAERQARALLSAQIAHEHRLKKAEDEQQEASRLEREREKQRALALAVQQAEQEGRVNFTAQTKSRQIKLTEEPPPDSISGFAGRSKEMDAIETERLEREKERSRSVEEARLRREEEIKRKAQERQQAHEEVRRKRKELEEQIELERRKKEEELFLAKGLQFRPSFSGNTIPDEPNSPRRIGGGPGHSRGPSRSSSFSGGQAVPMLRSMGSSKNLVSPSNRRKESRVPPEAVKELASVAAAVSESTVQEASSEDSNKTVLPPLSTIPSMITSSGAEVLIVREESVSDSSAPQTGVTDGGNTDQLRQALEKHLEEAATISEAQQLSSDSQSVAAPLPTLLSNDTSAEALDLQSPRHGGGGVSEVDSAITSDTGIVSATDASPINNAQAVEVPDTTAAKAQTS